MIQVGIMKPMLLAVLVTGAIGLWAGFTFGRSGTMATRVYAGLAVLIGANLLLSLWVWEGEARVW